MKSSVYYNPKVSTAQLIREAAQHFYETWQVRPATIRVPIDTPISDYAEIDEYVIIPTQGVVKGTALAQRY